MKYTYKQRKTGTISWKGRMHIDHEFFYPEKVKAEKLKRQEVKVKERRATDSAL